MTKMTREGARFWWGIELPKGVIYMFNNGVGGNALNGGIGGKWEEYTIAEHNAKKKEQQESNLRKKRYHTFRVPCLIHVFKLDTDFFYGGYFYIVIWSMYGMWYLNYKTRWEHEDFFPRIKRHLPFGLLPFDDDDDDVWFEEFCKHYPMEPKGIQKPRGKYLTHCKIDTYHNLVDIELKGEKKKNE